MDRFYPSMYLFHQDPDGPLTTFDQYALVLFPGLIVGRLFDIGYFRSVLLTCSILLVFTTLLTAHCTEYWHFLLCQGIATGVRCVEPYLNLSNAFW